MKRKNENSCYRRHSSREKIMIQILFTVHFMEIRCIVNWYKESKNSLLIFIKLTSQLFETLYIIIFNQLLLYSILISSATFLWLYIIKSIVFVCVCVFFPFNSLFLLYLNWKSIAIMVHDTWIKSTNSFHWAGKDEENRIKNDCEKSLMTKTII